MCLNKRSPLKLTIMSLLCTALTLLGIPVRPSRAAMVAWNGGTGSWYNAISWLPNIVPGGLDDVFIGSLPGAANQTVFIGDPGVAYNSLHLSNGMTLDMDGGELVSFGPAVIQGENTRLIATPAAGLNFYDFQGELDLGPGAFLQLEDSIDVRLHGENIVDGTISGRGDIEIASVQPLKFQGTLEPDANGGITLTQGPGDLFPINLDGLFGAGHFKLDTPFSTLTVNASQLQDPYSALITMAPGALLVMNIEDGWTADSSSQIQILGQNNPAAAAQIDGTALHLGSTINVGATAGRLRVLAETTLQPSANVTVQQSGRIDFAGPTTIDGGEFTTFSNHSADGSVRFNDETTWQGAVAINGIAHQLGDAAVTKQTSIQAGVLDMDGNGSTTWNIGHSLFVSTESIDSTFSNTFDGTLNIGGIFGKLNIELTGAFDKWTMNGQMDLSNNLPGVATRLIGSTMRLTGSLTTDGFVRVSANSEFGDGSQTTFADAFTELRMDASTLVEAGASFIGEGVLKNEVSGHMTLADGAVLDQVGLVNEGLLEVAMSPGIVSVDVFENTVEGTWLVEIGGQLAGDEHDLLQVTSGDSQLGGLLEVELVDAGNGLFLPEVGDEFTILTSVGDVLDQFVADPISHAAARQYHWEVLYNPHDVTLRLREITVPEPRTVVIGLTALLFTLTTTRRKACYI